jgi:hypothetical protein
MRILQQRLKPHPCIREINVKRYKDRVNGCYDPSFTIEEEEKEAWSKESFGQFKSFENGFRFTGPQEYYAGQFGNYWPNHGYMEDFFPYDMTKQEFRDRLDLMNDEGFISVGKTKMIDVDFSVAVPSSNYFVSVNCLMELTVMGQIIPTRLDALPYKLSPFADFKEDGTAIIDWFKILLVVYTVVALQMDYKVKSTIVKSKMKAFLFTLSENIIDLFVIFFQSLCFTIKYFDSMYFNIDPSKMLEPENRSKF